MSLSSLKSSAFALFSILLLTNVSQIAASAGTAIQDYRDKNFDYFVSGDPSLPRAAHTEQGLALMGGGGTVDDAYRFIARHAGGGHIVILGAESDDSFDPSLRKYSDYFTTRWGPAISAETIIFHNRSASFDPRVLAALRNADGIFMMGGDQGDYIRYWKGTPVQAALDAHVRANRPIGGSSAGLAIIGHYSYGSLDAGSMESKDALADPFNDGMTLEDDFLHFDWLDHVVTDSHFSQRSRLGRLIAFVARFDHDHPGVFGIGVDEASALLIESTGIGHMAAGSAGSAWIVVPQQPATILAKGKPLTFESIHVMRLDQTGTLDLASRTAQKPAADAVISVIDGKLADGSLGAAIFQRAAPPGHED